MRASATAGDPNNYSFKNKINIFEDKNKVTAGFSRGKGSFTAQRNSPKNNMNNKMRKTPREKFK